MLGLLNLSSSSLRLDNAIFFSLWSLNFPSVASCKLLNPSRNIIEWYIILNDVSLQTLHFSDLKFSFCYFGAVAISMLRFPICSLVTPIFSFKYLSIVIWLLIFAFFSAYQIYFSLCPRHCGLYSVDILDFVVFFQIVGLFKGNS